MTETPEQSATSYCSVTTGVVVGAIIGAALSLLYAPKPGAETRRELLQRLDDLKERVDHTARSVTEAARTRMAETRDDLAQAVEASRIAAAERAAELRRQAGLE